MILCHIPKLIKFLKLTKLPTLTFPNRTVFIHALICCQKVVAPSLIRAPICRYKGVDATLDEKSLRWIVLKRTAIAGIFLLAEAGMPL